MKENTVLGPEVSQRVKSVDFFRGLTMFLLAGEASFLYDRLRESDNGFIHFIGQHLDHHAWHGMYFWDLIQPFFMFIVGVAIPFAVANRLKKGDSQKSITIHAFKRSLLLLFIGWALYFSYAGHLVFRFQNVLAQLSFTYLVAYLIMKKSFVFQLSFSFILLLGIDLAYRFFPLAGYDHPWVLYENLGEWFNNLIEGEARSTEWATLNFVSTTAHTIWGVLFGKLLMSDYTSGKKIRIMIIAGLLALFIGYGLDFAGITPIIKKIATSSFVFASGGWAILALCFSYWLIDVKKLFSTGTWFFIVVGANSIFIYLFFSAGGAIFLHRLVDPFGNLIFGFLPELLTNIISCLMVWGVMWYLCFWLFKKKIFIKI